MPSKVKIVYLAFEGIFMNLIFGCLQNNRYLCKRNCVVLFGKGVISVKGMPMLNIFDGWLFNRLWPISHSIYLPVQCNYLCGA